MDVGTNNHRTTFTTDKHFRLVDINQRGCQVIQQYEEREEDLSTVIPSIHGTSFCSLSAMTIIQISLYTP
jgi:hypothetical protein